MPEIIENKTTTNDRDENDRDSGFSEEEARTILKNKRTKAQICYRRANAAVIPDFIPPEERQETDCELRETHVFTPNNGLSDKEINRFVYVAAQCRFNMEQALAVLHCNHYDVHQSYDDLEVFCPLPSRWRSDRQAFTNALREKDKYFYAIKNRFFPNRKVVDMVEYYYIWKMEKKKKIRKMKMKMKLSKKTCSPKNVATPVTTA